MRILANLLLEFTQKKTNKKEVRAFLSKRSSFFISRYFLIMIRGVTPPGNLHYYIIILYNIIYPTPWYVVHNKQSHFFSSHSATAIRNTAAYIYTEKTYVIAKNLDELISTWIILRNNHPFRFQI